MQFKPTELNNLIKEIRLTLGLNQTEFTKLCNFQSFQNLSNIERGIVPVSLKTIDKVCKACKLEFSVNINIETLND